MKQGTNWKEEKKKMSSGVVCVTGASGYIASWLVKLLLQRNYTVKASVRHPSLCLSLSISSFLDSPLFLLLQIIGFPAFALYDQFLFWSLCLVHHFFLWNMFFFIPPLKLSSWFRNRLTGKCPFLYLQFRCLVPENMSRKRFPVILII